METLLIFSWTRLLLALIGVSALVLIHAEYSGARRRVYVAKPLTTALIVVLALVQDPVVSPVYQTLVAIGLVFSLAGDVFLMLPNNRFVSGLISFLLAHLAYTSAFSTRAGFLFDMVALLPYLAVAAVMVSLLWKRTDSYRTPVFVYMIVILMMGWQALSLWRTVVDESALLAAAGAALFVMSDSILALDRFRRRLALASVLVLGTYFPAQVLIALSVCR